LFHFFGAGQKGLRVREGRTARKKYKGFFASSLCTEIPWKVTLLSDVATSKDLAKVQIKFEKIKLIWTLSGCTTDRKPAVDHLGLTKKLFLTNSATNNYVRQYRYCCNNYSFNVAALGKEVLPSELRRPFSSSLTLLINRRLLIA
jgi:hypothetical protein